MVGHFDVAVRDIVMSAAVFTLARLVEMSVVKFALPRVAAGKGALI